jgi:hypothetical protein
VTSLGHSTSIEAYRENLCIFRCSSLYLYRGREKIRVKLLSKKHAKFLDREASLVDKRSQSPPSKLAMIGDGETSVWWIWISKDDVAAGLMVELKTDFLESPEAT